MNKENALEKIKEESRELSGQVKEKTAGYILIALGLVAGLAWNDVVRAVIEYFFKAPENSITAKLTYAVIITLVVVIVSVYLAKIIRRQEEKK